MLTARKQDGNQIVASSVEVAESYSARIVGLIGRERLDEGHGLLLKRCSSVHTLFMRFPIGVIYLNDQNTVVAVETDLKPWRSGGIHWGAKHVLEVMPMTARSVSKGDTLIFEEGR